MGVQNNQYNNWMNAGNSLLQIDQDYAPSGVAWQSFNNRIEWVSIGGDNFKWQNLLHQCPALISILSKKCDALGSGLVEVVRYNDKDEAKKVRGEDKEWVKRMKNPNHLQSWSTFIRQLYFFLGIRGWCYAFPVYAAGFEDKAPTAIWLLPPWHVTVIVKPDAPPLHELEPDTKRRNVYLSWQGKRYEIDENDLILLTDPAAMTIDENTWLPQSRLVGLSYTISNYQAQYESRNMLIKSTGGWGIFSNNSKDSVGTITLSPDEKRELEENVKDYGSLRNQMPFIVTSYPLTYTPISRNAKELELHQENASTIQDMCDRFNYPFHLMSAAAGKGGSTTFNNVDEAMKYMYTNTVYEANHITSELNSGFARISKNDNLPQVRISYEHIECLQESEAEAAQGEQRAMEAMLIRWEMGNCTQNDILERAGQERVSKEEFDMYKPQYDDWLRKQGLLPQMNINEDGGKNLTSLEKQNAGAKPNPQNG